MSSHHKSNLGMFGERLITDIDGYTYTTADEWMIANIDADFCDPNTGEYDEEYHQEWAEEQAAAARAALDEANNDVVAWRQDNS